MNVSRKNNLSIFLDFVIQHRFITRKVNSDHKRLINTKNRETLLPDAIQNGKHTQNTSSREHVSSVSVFTTTSNGIATGKPQETPRQRDIVYFDRQRPRQNPDYSKAKDQDLCTARNIAKSLRLKEAGYLFPSVLILSLFYNQ